MSVEDLLEQIGRFLPTYLTPTEKEELFEELEGFPDNKGFFLNPDAPGEEILQGDGWHGFIAIHFHRLEKRVVSGLVISNSCDIDVRNTRDLPVRVLFTPLIPLEAYRTLLLEAGRADEQVESKMTDIRAQRVTSIFYLPDAQFGPPESVILLDDIHAHPLDHFVSSERSRLFRLNNYGFYILLLKLSIHLSRFREDLSRSA